MALSLSEIKVLCNHDMIANALTRQALFSIIHFMKESQNELSAPKLTVHALPAFEDNYLWLLQIGKLAIAVDPGDADVVETALKQLNLQLVAILITHHHHDHIGGVEALFNQHACEIYAPRNSPIPQPTISATKHQAPALSRLGLECQVLELPGHTLDHIAYLIQPTHSNQGHLFLGDVLFSAGCGRVFEGTYAQMWTSLQHIQQLPSQTLIYPAHEYTLKNLQFAKQVESNNQALLAYEQTCQSLRLQGKPTLPTRLETELAINPFLRCSRIGVSHNALDTFIALRKQRNTY